MTAFIIPEPPKMILANISLAEVIATLTCPHSQYSLRGLVENRCPECGWRFDPIHLLRRGANHPGKRKLCTLVKVIAIIFVLWVLLVGTRI